MIKEDYEIENQEDEDLRCPICNYYFSTITKPYLLPCNHNLCSTCIDRIINKNMLYCPLCRKEFSLDDRSKFQVNFAFLNLVIKILKTKVIYCNKCSKIFNWTEHHLVCDQSQFKETNEIFDEIKILVDNCVSFLKESDATADLKTKTLLHIISMLSNYKNSIENEFYKKANEEIDSFYNSIPNIDINSMYVEILNFIKICEPLYASLNINSKEVNEIVEQLDKDDNKSYRHPSSIVGSSECSLDESYSSIRQKSDLTTKDPDTIPTMRRPFMTPLSINVTNRINQSMKKGEEHKEEEEAKENFDKLNYIVSIYKKIGDLTSKIQNHTRQVEFTTETIKSQINSNYNSYSNKIFSDLSSIHNTISVNENKDKTFHNFFIHYIDNTRKIWLYNILTNKCEIIEFSLLPSKLNSSFAIDFNERTNFVYLSGGEYTQTLSLFSNDTTISNQLLLFLFKENLSDKDITTIQMPHRRAYHSTIFHNDKLYIIGGYNEKKQPLKETECYNVKDKVWELLPNLRYGRVNPTLCVYNNSYLYVFRGMDEESNSHIEFININNFFPEWTCVHIDDPGSCFTPMIKSGACVISPNMIMICGGTSNIKDKDMVPYCYIYNPIKKSVYRSKDMAKAAFFSHGGIMNENNNKIYIIDDKNETGNSFGVHVYDIEKNIWTYNS